MNDTPSTRSPRLLDDAEHQVHAALALGRRLLAEPHPSRPIHELQLHEMFGHRFGLRIWASWSDPGAMDAWAALLDSPVVATPSETDPTGVGFRVDGDLEGIPLYVWTRASIPITRATIATNSRGVRVVYTQGGARRILPQPNKAAARLWVAQHVRQAVPTC